MDEAGAVELVLTLISDTADHDTVWRTEAVHTMASPAAGRRRLFSMIRVHATQCLEPYTDGEWVESTRRVK